MKKYFATFFELLFIAAPFGSASSVWAVTLGEALDAGGAWTIGSDETYPTDRWWAAETQLYDGTSGWAAYGDVVAGYHESIVTNVDGPITLKFYQKVYSVFGASYLQFLIDGVQKESVTGDINSYWVQKTYVLGPGNHELKWVTYAASNFIGTGSSYVDKVQYVPVSTPVLAWTGETGYTVDGVSPDADNHSGNFTFKVKYSDTDGKAPGVGYPRLFITKGGSNIASSPFVMSDVSGNYVTGEVYSVSKTLSLDGSDYAYWFEAIDTAGKTAGGAPASSKAGPIFNFINLAPALDYVGEAGYVSDGIAPDSGVPSTTFVFKIKYFDPENDAAASGYPKLHLRSGASEISGSPFSMTYVSGANPADGVVYSYSEALAVPATDYQYYFEAQDIYSAAFVLPGTPAALPVYSYSAPVLSWTRETNYLNDGVYPKAAGSNDLSVFRVKYSDADNDAPAAGYPKLYVKKGSAQLPGSPFSLSCSGAGYVAGVVCDYSKVLGVGDYSYRFEAFDTYNGLASGAPALENGGLISVGTDLPAAQEVKVYHGVFKPGQDEKTNISFNTAASVTITIAVYNNVGRKVKELYRGSSSSGLNLIQWDGRDSGGAKVSSGVYTIKIEGGGINQTKRVVVVR